MEPEHICFRVELFWGRAVRKHDGWPKVRNSFRFGRASPKTVFFGCRRDAQSRINKSLRKCAPQSSHRLLLSFEFQIISNKNCSCRSGVLLVVRKHLKTNSFRCPGPARHRCVSGIGSDVFFGGRSREPSVSDRFCSDDVKNATRIVRFNRACVRPQFGSAGPDSVQTPF